MPRQPRLRGPDMWFHIFNRGADRQDLFHDDHDFIAFEGLLDESTRRFGIQIHADALMTNHYHLLTHCPKDVLSSAMHWIGTSYAGRYNRRYARTGPLFEGRFRSVPVVSDAQLLHTSRYVHKNPAAIVGDRAIAAYRWSSLGAYVGTRPTPAWLSTDAVLEQFSHDCERYRTFVDAEIVLGELPEAIDGPRLSVVDIESAVSVVADLDAGALQRPDRGAISWPKLAAIVLTTEERAAPSAEIAARFGLPTAGAARAAARRGRALRESDPGFRRFCDRVTAVLLE